MRKVQEVPGIGKAETVNSVTNEHQATPVTFILLISSWRKTVNKINV